MTNQVTCFNVTDYAGPGIRIAIWLIDVIALLFVLIVLVLLGLVLYPPDINHSQTSAMLWTIFSFLYLGPIHSSRLRTVGYLVFGYRLVDYRGERPKFWRTAVRGSTIMMLPLEAFFDITLSQSRRTRQATWDRLSETMVVRESAQPVGRKDVAYKLEFAHGMTLISREPEWTPGSGDLFS